MPFVDTTINHNLPLIQALNALGDELSFNQTHLQEPKQLYERYAHILGYFYPGLIQNKHYLRELDIATLFQTRLDEFKSSMALHCDESSVMTVTRQFRYEMLYLIALKQFKIRADYDDEVLDATLFEENTQDILLMLSNLADHILEVVANFVYHSLSLTMGVPTNSLGEKQPFIIIAMGKLGGRELNFSSDIDLIFTYPDSGQTVYKNDMGEVLPAKSKDNQQFFTKLAQRLIRILDTVNEEGFVYRVDMRLRPFGDSGPLVISYNALEDYYQEQGRDWERYAMIKARVVGPIAEKHRLRLNEVLRPFTYRRYIDFGVIDSLREMKLLIEREVRRKEGQLDIKLSAGGIREIEFIIQVIQLIHGGRIAELRTHSILDAIERISAHQLMDIQTLETLKKHYLYFRRFENVLQSIHDEQTQLLPTQPLDQIRLTYLMAERSWDELIQKIMQAMKEVRGIFNLLIAEKNDDYEVTLKNTNHQTSQSQVATSSSPLISLFTDACHYIAQGFSLAEVLDKIGINQDNVEHQIIIEHSQLIADFYYTLQNRSIGPKGRQVLDKLIPLLVLPIISNRDSVDVTKRIIHVIKHVVTRTAYLQLLFENNKALNNFIMLCRSSSLIAKRLARYPHLLGELLDSKTLFKPIDISEYQNELNVFMLRTEPFDIEDTLNALCQFKQIQQLRIAAADVSGFLPLMKVSDHLTQLAEVILGYVTQLAINDLEKKFGKPSFYDDNTPISICVVAYGKLAGWELGYRSDLDLIFLTDTIEDGATLGERSIDNHLFFQRLGQRIIHLLSARTNSGLLYEVDTRLRPRGDSGLLVNTFSAYEAYLLGEAWTYEHQALVRSRVVFAHESHQQYFNQIRLKVLTQQREIGFLKHEIIDMREKMLSNIKSNQQDSFDLKQARFGITDIEFIAQFFVLAYAHKAFELTVWPDNIRIFETLVNQSIIAVQEGQDLCQSYIKMRSAIHHLSLNDKPSIENKQLFEKDIALVQSQWQKWLLE